MTTDMTSAPQPQGQPPARASVYALKFHGEGTDLAIIVLKNFLLSIVTVGIYSFWGKVNVRKFLWHNTEFHGHRLTFHGTGKELLIGWAKVAGIFLAFQLVVNGAMLISPALGGLLSVLFGLGFLVLVPYAIYQSQRYLMSRTTWRGIRFGMRPEAKEFVNAFVKGYLLTIVTLGFYGAVWQNRLYAVRMNNTRIGTLEVRYTGTNREAFKIFLSSLPWLILTLGIYFFWYQARVSEFRSQHTWIGSATLGAARGHLELTGADNFKLWLVNILAIVFSFGLAMPWVIAHNMAFYLKRFAFVGQLNFDAVQQLASTGSAAAEGMADVMDVGFGV